MWKTGLQTDTELTGEVLIDRVSIDTYGRLVVEFQSRTHFRGLFVDKHHSIPSETKATFEPPMNVQTNFTLELVWTEETYETPVQVLKNQKISGYLFSFLALESNLDVQSKGLHWRIQSQPYPMQCEPNSKVPTRPSPITS